MRSNLPKERYFPPADYPSIASLREAKQKVFAATRRYLDGLSEQQLKRHAQATAQHCVCSAS
jgi:hypothetical protein